MDGSKGVCVFYEVLVEFGGSVACSERILVFLEPCGKSSAGLSHIRLTTVGACQLVYSVSVCLKSVAYALTISV